MSYMNPPGDQSNAGLQYIEVEGIGWRTQSEATHWITAGYPVTFPDAAALRPPSSESWNPWTANQSVRGSVSSRSSGRTPRSIPPQQAISAYQQNAYGNVNLGLRAQHRLTQLMPGVYAENTYGNANYCQPGQLGLPHQTQGLYPQNTYGNLDVGKQGRPKIPQYSTYPHHQNTYGNTNIGEQDQSTTAQQKTNFCQPVAPDSVMAASQGHTYDPQQPMDLHQQITNLAHNQQHLSNMPQEPMNLHHQFTNMSLNQPGQSNMSQQKRGTTSYTSTGTTAPSITSLQPVNPLSTYPYPHNAHRQGRQQHPTGSAHLCASSAASSNQSARSNRQHQITGHRRQHQPNTSSAATRGGLPDPPPGLLIPTPEDILSNTHLATNYNGSGCEPSYRPETQNIEVTDTDPSFFLPSEVLTEAEMPMPFIQGGRNGQQHSSSYLTVPKVSKTSKFSGLFHAKRPLTLSDSSDISTTKAMMSPLAPTFTPGGDIAKLGRPKDIPRALHRAAYASPSVSEADDQTSEFSATAGAPVDPAILKRDEQTRREQLETTKGSADWGCEFCGPLCLCGRMEFPDEPDHMPETLYAGILGSEPYRSKGLVSKEESRR